MCIPSIFFCLITSSIFTLCHAHTPNPYTKENKCVIAQPVLNMHEECSEESPLVSQGIYGHSASVIQDVGDGWGLIETEDNYQGYALLSGLIPDDPRWRTSKRLCRISSIAGMVYPIQDTVRPALLRLSFGSRIELVEDLDSSDARWIEVQLLDGRRAWMQRGDLEKPRTKTREEMIELAHQFIGLPYIWCGTSSEGYDCSGYIQTLYKEIGVILPRFSQDQAKSDQVFAIPFPEQPGDLLFFGKEEISHVGMYLGDRKFIHAGVSNNTPRIAISSIDDQPFKLLATRRLKEIAFQANSSPITDQIKTKMTHSWREDNPVPLNNLQYILLNYWGFDRCVHQGELIAHKDVANEIIEIFEELFDKQYPIEKMLLMDTYQADDDLACEDNNSSAFCSRPITGSTSKWSLHSYGFAIDINTLLNPYQKGDVVVPAHKKDFLDRTIDCHGVITEEDLCYKAFISRGWKWGGHWYKDFGLVDYQHFEKERSTL